jgi:Photosynthetic reaction centre cytochrome C subunit
MWYVTLVFLLLCPLSASPQDQAPNLSGVWRRETSDPARDMLVKIEQSGSDLTVTFRSRNNGAEEINVERLRIGAADNANQIHGAPMSSKAAWDGPTLVVDSVASFGDEKLRMTDRWTLSADRQTLTLVERHQFGAEPEPGTDSYVLRRQPAELWPALQPSKPAEQVYPNIQMLKGVPAERIPAIMSTFSRVLNVACTHCHVEGAMEKDDKPTFAKARRMYEMRNWIAQNAKVETTCWTCHRGHATPEAAPPADPAIWPADLNLSAEQGAQPASKVYQNLKFFNSTAADIKSAMLFQSASLGVGCAHCHVPGAWEKDDKPAKDTARMMLAMVRDTRREFSDIRIGCPICHHGAEKPQIAPPAGQ